MSNSRKTRIDPETVLGTPEDLRKSLLHEARFERSSKPKGRQVSTQALDELTPLLGERISRRDLLIENLHLIQDTFHGLSEDHLVALAHLMKISMAEVYEVATFYHHFDVLSMDEKAPQFTIRVCAGLSCELQGAKDLLQKLPTILGRDDIKIIEAPCVGRCEQAPIAVVHQHPVIFANPQKIEAAVRMGLLHHPQAHEVGEFEPEHVIQKSVTGLDREMHMPDPLQVSPAFRDYQTYLEHGGYALLKKIHAEQITADQAIASLEDSGLRGLGGAGFPAGRKWRIVRAEAGPRLMAVNIDEGEPGTFKDRTYLERDPHRFLEGMLIAAQVVGIESCYIYLRDEYHGCRDLLQRELQKLMDQPPCPLPHIELRRGAGAYICGEESAMIESLEGKRGEPRMRPPYIAQKGLFGRPTLEHNFETLYWVRDILEKGAAWFSGYGRHGRKGLRSFSVSGRVKHPGVKLAPAGITVQELIDEYCGGMAEGHELYAYLPGGASGGILPARLNQVPLDFDTLQSYGCFIGSAAVIVLSHKDRARDAALNMMRFFEHESCGQCTPCRVGTAKAAKLMEQPVWDQALLNDLSQVMADASICGLGQAAPNPIQCIQKYFMQEISA